MARGRRIIDISTPLGPATPVYPGDPAPSLTRLSEAAGGDSFSLSRLVLGTHTGTHVDPPAHFLPGAATVDQLPLDTLIGRARLLVLATSRPVEPADLAAVPRGTRRLLLCAGGQPLSEGAAEWLVRRGVRLVGVDGLSVAPEHAPGPVHHLLLGAGVVIVEGLALAGVPAGLYTLVCLPLLIANGDGAPARAVLIAGRR